MAKSFTYSASLFLFQWGVHAVDGNCMVFSETRQYTLYIGRRNCCILIHFIQSWPLITITGRSSLCSRLEYRTIYTMRQPFCRTVGRFNSLASYVDRALRVVVVEKARNRAQWPQTTWNTAEKRPFAERAVWPARRCGCATRKMGVATISRGGNGFAWYLDGALGRGQILTSQSEGEENWCGSLQLNAHPSTEFEKNPRLRWVFGI